MKTLIQLFLIFARVGGFTFGGGYPLNLTFKEGVIVLWYKYMGKNKRPLKTIVGRFTRALKSV